MKHSIRFLFLAAFACSAAGCVSSGEHQRTMDELDRARDQLKVVENTAQDFAAENERLRRENSGLRADNSSLSTNYDQARGRNAELERQMADLKSSLPTNVDLVKTPGGYAYSVKGEFLFDSGKHELKPSGRKTLGEIAELLKGNDYKIEVAGHTDTDQVQVTKDQYRLGNIELGADRALAVWQALKDAGIPEERIKVSSYGPYEPIGADKSKNRRVEVRVLVAEPTAQ